MNLMKKITDEDIGEKICEMKNVIYREAARGIVTDDQGNMAVFYKKNKNQYKLPGGGLEKSETFEEAFLREVKEEVGCEIEIIEYLGEIEENKTKDNFVQISRVFVRKS